MAALPTGTVTLLFTDVEGSTRLVHALGEGWEPVLEQHHGILRGAVADADGCEIDCRADVGLDVHRAARICSAANGGQVLLSAAVRDALTSPPELRDLGTHALRGLPHAEPLIQLVAPGLPVDFPPPNAEPSPSGPRPRVVLAEDSVLLREGIGRLLEDAGFEVAAQSGTADDLLRDVALHAPDVAIIDVRMPPTHTDEGLRAAKEIRRLHPGVGVLVLSQFVEPAYARELLDGSPKGVGYLLKDRVADVAEFAAAVRTVAAGGFALDPELPFLGA